MSKQESPRNSDNVFEQISHEEPYEEGEEEHRSITGVTNISLAERYPIKIRLRRVDDNGKEIERGGIPLLDEKQQYGILKMEQNLIIGYFRNPPPNSTGRVRDQADFNIIRSRRKIKPIEPKK